ncbi:MAG: hypothetical protein QME52_07890 [Bacteroidota bacterium]|nr:hypothetical protein [Bacteroidota bacterium]
MRSSIVLLLIIITLSFGFGGERLVLQLKDFTKAEVKSGGFSLPSEAAIHIYAIGGGEKKSSFSNRGMYAYGWIINADTREVVWMMDRDNTSRQKQFRECDEIINLNKGGYEVYFSAHGYVGSSIFSNFIINIDRRRDIDSDKKIQRRGFLNWIEELFGEDYYVDWKQQAKKWEISVYVDDSIQDVETFNTPKEFTHVLFKSIQLGENERIRQRFSTSKPMPIRIYALGEKDYSDEFADYGWIIDLKTHKRIWDMEKCRTKPAGGDAKNKKCDAVFPFPEGDFMLYYHTDNSHSFLDWNTAPPTDPFNYGITLIATDEKNIGSFSLTSAAKPARADGEEQNVIVQLVKVGDDETRNTSFTLKEDASVRIYAIGEKGYSRKMADYGWIINAKTREKIWNFDPDKSEHAGGAKKNRLIDEFISLPKGTYTVFYQTDDSHSYDDWNADPPFDLEHYGITIYGGNENFSMNIVERNVKPQETGVVAQIVRVGDSEDRTQAFHLDHTTRIRIYAIGEGLNREMYDYGWIENVKTNEVVWEMTFSMTFHAGGGRKNRSVSTTILLYKGDYTLHYVSDDSHSFKNWNTDPPDDPTMWGITLYIDK